MLPAAVSSRRDPTAFAVAKRASGFLDMFDNLRQTLVAVGTDLSARLGYVSMTEISNLSEAMRTGIGAKAPR